MIAYGYLLRYTFIGSVLNKKRKRNLLNQYDDGRGVVESLYLILLKPLDKSRGFFVYECVILLH